MSTGRGDLRERLAVAARPRRPWLRVRASPFWAQVLLAAGARPTSTAPDTQLAAQAETEAPAGLIVSDIEELEPDAASLQPPIRVGGPSRARWLPVSVGASSLAAACALVAFGLLSNPPRHTDIGIVIGYPTAGTAVPPPTTTPIGTSETSPSGGSTVSPPLTDPADVVEAYFAAINAHDYQLGWDLGGQNFGGTFASYVAGFSQVAQVDVTVTAVHGTVVSVTLTSVLDDGTRDMYAGTYTVTNGTITSSHLAATN